MSNYTSLIPALHADKPAFVATVALTTEGFSSAATALGQLALMFDVDTAVGEQLDFIGLWVGVSRVVHIPIAGAFFSYDTLGLGWNEANWKGPYDPVEGIVALDDLTYRAVLKAKIGANYWGGTNETSLDSALDMQVAGTVTFAVDNMNMSTDVYIAGEPTAALIELVKRGVSPPKAAGVRIANFWRSGTTATVVFALDVDASAMVGGLDIGSFIIPA